MLLLIVAALATMSWAQTADLVVVNATVYTVDEVAPEAASFAVQGGRIIAIGDVSGYEGPQTRRFDARGATIVPGFIDSHGHMAGFGESLEIVDLRDVTTVNEALRRVAQAASKMPAGSWISGRGWDQTRWPGGQFPTADELSRAAPNHPAYLTRVDGHAAWVNRRALEIGRITASTEDPPGGRILRTESGEPSGILLDNAKALVASTMPEPYAAQVGERIARAAREVARLGLTTVHDAGINRAQLDAYRALITEKRLPIRIYAMIGGEGQLWDAYLKKGPEIDDRLTVRAIKLMADGALGSRGAALKEPYSDDPGNSGLLILQQADIERVARAAVERGFQVATHAIGDRANRVVLDAYGAVLGGENSRRFRIEHAQVVSEDDFALFKKYSIIPSIQSTHATSDMRWAADRLGPQRVRGAYAWQRFLEVSPVLPNGSDFPVESANPLWGFYAAITRQDADGQPASGWQRTQRLSREEALKSSTLDGAYAAFQERSRGSLREGKLADFVVLSKDIMRVPPLEILSTRVTATFVGGEIVYQEGR